MATERVTVTVESNIGEDGPLTVMDTLDQFKDAFELLTAAIAQEPGGEKIKWRLERLSKNSPATVSAVAYSSDPEVVVAPLLHRGKQRFARDMNALREGSVAPWIRGKSSTAKAMLRRNLNGVGRTTFGFEDDAPSAILVEKAARASLKALERVEAEEELVDHSHSEFGMLDGHVAEAKTWNGKPAIYLKDRLSGRVVPCVLTEDLAEIEGKTHSWADAWAGKRLRVRGQLFYDKTGAISRISAIELLDVSPKPANLHALRSLDVLDGKSPTEHLDNLWGYTDD